jgi:hypothetical protein
MTLGVATAILGLGLLVALLTVGGILSCRDHDALEARVAALEAARSPARPIPTVESLYPVTERETCSRSNTE